MKIKNATAYALAVLLAFGWITVERMILGQFGSDEWLSPNLYFIMFIYPIIHGVIHQVGRRTSTEQKVLFNKVKISTRLYATLVTLLILLACCAVALLVTHAEPKSMIAPIMAVVIFFVNEEIGYQGSRIVRRYLGHTEEITNQPEKGN